MTTHARQQLIDGVTALLNAAGSTNWRLVQKTRLLTTRTVMPHLQVYVEDENIDPLTVVEPKTYMRDALLVVRGVLPVSEIQTTEERLNDVSKDIEAALTASALISQVAQAKELVLTGTGFDIVPGDNDTPQYATVTVTWRIRYVTVEGAPQTLA